MKMTFDNFTSFYAFYLTQHQHPYCRLCHFIGLTLAIACILIALFIQSWWFILVALILGYTCAWIGHFYIENNRPATFGHPVYSFVADWVMYKDILCGKLSIRKK